MRGFVFVLPRLDFRDEFFALEIGSALAFLREHALFHDGLRGDAGMIRARQPDSVIPSIRCQRVRIS